MEDCVSQKVLYNDAIFDVSRLTGIPRAEGLVLYEVLRVIDSRPLFVEDHVARLFESARIMGVALWRSGGQIIDDVLRFVACEGFENGNVKLLFVFNGAVKYSLIYQIRHSYPSVDMYVKGVATDTLALERNNPNAKNVQPFKLVAEKYIKDKHLYEALLTDASGNVTEGSRSNVFFMQRNEVVTALPQDVLLGITRKYVIEACRNIGLEVIERKIPVEDLKHFQSAFVCGTSPKVLPIARIGDVVLSCDNPVLSSIMLEYDNIIARYLGRK